MHKHPNSNVQRLIDAAFDGTQKLCSAGCRGYYILLSGDYAPCAPMFRKFGRMGNILQDAQFRQLSGQELVCPEFPPEHPDLYPSPVPELSCWCLHNTVEFVPPGQSDEELNQRMSAIGAKAPAHVLWEMSRLCNFSCHYCLTSDKVFNNRTSKNYVSGSGEQIIPRTLDELKVVADKIFAQFDSVNLVLAGPMEPLTNAHIVDLLRYMLRYREKVSALTITTNGSLAGKLNEIVAMGWREKLIVYCSLHILEDNFDPFSIVRTIQLAYRNNVNVEVHCIPSDEVRKFLPEYMRFFSLFGIKVNVHPLVVDFGGASVMKYSYPDAFEPKSLPPVRNFVRRVWSEAVTPEESRFLAAAADLNVGDEPVFELRAQPSA